MRKSFFYLFSSICLFGAVIFGAFSLFFDNADASSIQTNVLAGETDGQGVNLLPAPLVTEYAGEVDSDVSVNSRSLEIITPDLSEPDHATIIESGYEVLARVETFHRRYSKVLLANAPGWVLIKAERYSPNTNIPLANGQHVPDSYIEEHWVNIDRNNEMVQVVNRSLTANGELLRQNYANMVGSTENHALEQDGSISNLNENSERASYPITLDYGAHMSVRTGVELGGEVQGWIEVEGGIEKYIVTITEYFDAPVQFAGQAQKSTSLQNRLTFDVGNGRFLQGQMIHQFENGETIVAEIITVLDIQMMSSMVLPPEIKQTIPQE